MIFKRPTPSIAVYIISIDKVFSNQLLLKIEEETDCMILQELNDIEFFQEIEASPNEPHTIPIVLIDYNLNSLDYQSPKNGVEIAREIKTVYPHWEIIIMSEMNVTKIKEDAIKNGAHFHVYKNDNTAARIIKRIHEIENDFYIKYQKKMLIVSIIIFIVLLAILIVSKSIFNIIEQ